MGTHAGPLALPLLLLAAALSLLVLTEAAQSPITIPLTRYVNHAKRNSVLLALKLRQSSPSLLEMGDVPLKEEVLSQKHLATYYGEIQIGDEATFRVLFDTGSCEFWVPSSECTTQRCKNHRRYPVHGNEKKLGHAMSIQYLSGKVAGDMIYATITLGDIKVFHQVVGLGRTVDIDLLDDVEWDGILGLAYENPTLKAQGVVPLFDNIISAHVLKDRGYANQFAYYIDDEKGAVTFGGANCDLISSGTDKTNCIDQFKFVPVTEKTYWTITIKDVEIKYPSESTVRKNLCPEAGCKAIVDTGTYLIYGPADQVQRGMTTSLNGCSNHNSMPDITFKFAAADGETPVAVTLKPIDYILKFDVDGREDCVVGISPDQDTIWTLGQVFLRSFYTVFDRDEDRIGFARLPRTNFAALHASPDKVTKRHNSPTNNNRKHTSQNFLEVNDISVDQRDNDPEDLPGNEHWDHF